MFETAVLSTGPQTKRVWTTLLGFSGQALLLTGLVLVPLISPQSLPKVVWTAMTLAPPAPPPPPPVPLTQVVPRVRVAATRVFNDYLVPPTKIPTKIEIINDLDEAVPRGQYVVGAVASVGVPGGVPDIIGDVIRSVPVFKPPERVVEPPSKAPTAPVKPPRIAVLQMAEPIQRTTPVYPQIARTARVSGKVELLGVLGTDGRIHEVKILSGHPLLVKAAVDAVMQWVYRPTILNGQAVEVQAPIVVNFILN